STVRTARPTVPAASYAGITTDTSGAWCKSRASRHEREGLDHSRSGREPPAPHSGSRPPSMGVPGEASGAHTVTISGRTRRLHPRHTYSRFSDMRSKKKPAPRLSRLELEVLDALWTLGPSSVREVQEHFPKKGRPAYTTVQTIVYR